MIQINISNRAMYSLIAVIMVIAIAGIAYAYGGSTPTIVGHSAMELENVCRWSGTEWVDCPVVYNGNILYQYDPAGYTGGTCTSNCNGSFVSLPDTAGTPNCTNYLDYTSSSSATVCRSDGRIQCQRTGGGFVDYTYHCAKPTTPEAKIVTYEFDFKQAL